MNKNCSHICNQLCYLGHLMDTNVSLSLKLVFSDTQYNNSLQNWNKIKSIVKFSANNTLSDNSKDCYLGFKMDPLVSNY